MKKSLKFILLLFMLLPVLVTGCMEREGLEDILPDDEIAYECLYECIWTVAYFPEEDGAIPPLISDESKALYFPEGASEVRMLQDVTEEGEDKKVYTHYADYEYFLDYTQNIIEIYDGDKIYVFRINVMNDRNMTFYYTAQQCEDYIAYKRLPLSSVTIGE